MSDPRIAVIRNAIRDVPDFPKPGILFKDIAPILEQPAAFAAAIDCFTERFAGTGVERVAGLESRGFLFGPTLAARLGVGFSMLRKKGKLPSAKVGVDYALEYGTDRIEAHADTVSPGMKVLLIDDLLATGGTAAAAIHLLQGVLGAQVVAAAFVVELEFLGGRSKLSAPVHSLVTY